MATTKRIRKTTNAAHKAERGRPKPRAKAQKAGAAGKRREPRGASMAQHDTPSRHADGRSAQRVGNLHGRKGGPASNDGDTTLRAGSKGSTILDLLRRNNGATIGELTEATGWQPHSIRGFLSGALKRKLGLTIASEKGDDGQRRYHITS